MMQSLCRRGATVACLAFSYLSYSHAEVLPIPPHIEAIQVSTPKPVTDGQMKEFKQDFVDVDFNRDDLMDGQEVRAHFKGGISDVELFHFFLDCDTDMSGDISLQEYVNYAAMLS
eukprot:TRINITY_DN18497_c1_g1_i1.p1 TRINITY_DN18497_c1_g1~~TRINITY_DN18497_c1_g1_i1.p1  ORF type:complete len:115 (+),score=22.52 TRINITY_DN18497_c1_g1_i1:69-413(+)